LPGKRIALRAGHHDIFLHRRRLIGLAIAAVSTTLTIGLVVATLQGRRGSPLVRMRI
jgi:hypothetical protein